MVWTWATATARERGEWVRTHGKMNLEFLDLCNLFNLTANGAWKILKGDDWRPDYDMDQEKERCLALIRDAVERSKVTA